MAKKRKQGQLRLLDAGQKEAILLDLYARGGIFAKAIDEEVAKQLDIITEEEVADQLMDAFNEVDDDDAYAHSGRGSWGYREYGEAVSMLLEEQFKPFIRKMVSFIKEGRADIARSYVKGIILGCCRFEQECHYDYIDAIPDDCSAFAEEALDTWTKSYGHDIEAMKDMQEFITLNCPEWRTLARW